VPRVLRVVALAGVLNSLFAACAAPGDRAVTVYGGKLVNAKLAEEILPAQDLHTVDSYLVAVAPSMVFARPSERVQWELEAQVVKHFGDQEHWELGGLVDTRWTSFPWDETVGTSAAIGGGLSLASEVPAVEQALHEDRGGSRELLFLLMLELGIGPPRPSPWSVVTRIHHRSGVFGFFDGVRGGSNFITFGLRWEF
jgi:hypothetical protein